MVGTHSVAAGRLGRALPAAAGHPPSGAVGVPRSPATRFTRWRVGPTPWVTGRQQLRGGP